MLSELPQTIGIVGGSCAGKSWLAARLQALLGPGAARLSQDDFYLDRAHLSAGQKKRVNFDHPRSIDWARLESVLSQAAAGCRVAVPRYDFASHGRLSSDGVLPPARIILVEGLWLFRRASLRKRFALRIFIRSTDELCVERRLARDVAERGRTREQVLMQLERFTFPMFARFVAPQEKWADVVLNAPIRERDVCALAQRITANFQGGRGASIKSGTELLPVGI
jgi:uridine kinase